MTTGEWRTAGGGFLLEPWLEDHRAMMEVALEDALSAYKGEVPPALFDAMEYTLLGGGKRLRPVICLAAAH